MKQVTQLQIQWHEEAASVQASPAPSVIDRAEFSVASAAVRAARALAAAALSEFAVGIYVTVFALGLLFTAAIIGG